MSPFSRLPYTGMATTKANSSPRRLKPLTGQSGNWWPKATQLLCQPRFFRAELNYTMLNTSGWVHSVSTLREQPWWKNILKIHVDASCITQNLEQQTWGKNKEYDWGEKSAQSYIKSQYTEASAEPCGAETGVLHSAM